MYRYQDQRGHGARFIPHQLPRFVKALGFVPVVGGQTEQPGLRFHHVGSGLVNGIIHGDEDDGQKHDVDQSDQHDADASILQRHHRLDSPQRLFRRHRP